MNTSNNFSFSNSGDANVTLNVIDTGGETALKIFQALIGLVVFIIGSPVIIPLLIVESRRQNRMLEGGE